MHTFALAISGKDNVNLPLKIQTFVAAASPKDVSLMIWSEMRRQIERMLAITLDLASSVHIFLWRIRLFGYIKISR